MSSYTETLKRDKEFLWSRFFHLVVGQLLAQRGQQVAQLGGRDEPVAVLVEVPQPLDEVVRRVAAARLADGLQRARLTAAARGPRTATRPGAVQVVKKYYETLLRKSSTLPSKGGRFLFNPPHRVGHRFSNLFQAS